MCNVPLVIVTTAMPMQTCPFWDGAKLTGVAALARILDDVPNRTASPCGVGITMPPVPYFVGFWEPVPVGHPPDNVVVGSPALCEFKDPLVPERDP
jgi:hypothetical protein